jgi:hypothetical protein
MKRFPTEMNVPLTEPASLVGHWFPNEMVARRAGIKIVFSLT